MKRCKFCGSIMDQAQDLRSMAQDVISHGRMIVAFLMHEGFTAGDICNFCYAHLCVFKHERESEYEKMTNQK